MSTSLEKARHLYEILPDGRWKLRFDHHQIEGFARCEQYFKYRHVDQYRHKGGMGWYAQFGIWFAHVLEDYYKDMRSRQEQKIGPSTKGDFIVTAIKRWKSDDMDRYALMAPRQYETFAQGYVGMTMGQGQMIKVPVGAVNLAAGYYDFSENRQDFTRWRIIAAEEHFGINDEVKIAENDKVVVCFQGRPDIVVYDNHEHELQPIDTKTTGEIDASFRFSWKPHAQILGYVVCVQELANQLKIDTKVRKCVINAISRNKPADTEKGRLKSRYDRVVVPHSDFEIENWQRQMLAKAMRLRYCIENDEWMWRETACHNQYGYPCDFRDVDNKKSQEERNMILASVFEKVTPWTAKGD